MFTKHVPNVNKSIHTRAVLFLGSVFGNRFAAESNRIVSHRFSSILFRTQPMTKHVETNPATEIRNTYPPAKRCTALFVLVCDAIIVHCLEKQLNQDIYINLTKHFTEKSPGNKYTLTTDLHLQLNICWFKRVGCCVTADWILIGRGIKWVKWLFQTDIDIEVEGLQAQA